MNLAALPPSITLAAVFIAGTLLGSLANWAIYRLAWNPREISPWGPTPADAAARTLWDRMPVVGWLGLAREAKLHGRGFWLRPLLVELAMGLGLAALCWWQVYERGLVVPQLDELLLLGQVAHKVDPALIPSAAVWPTFLSHALLVTLMVATSFIDIDEKIVPDEITVPGTILGLVVATCAPMCLLPVASIPQVPPVIGLPVSLEHLQPGLLAYVEPATLVSPREWPNHLDGAPRWQNLLAGWGCWWLWCFALAPRFWRGRRSAWRKILIITRRVAREVTRGLLGTIAATGTVAIAGVWAWGGDPWIGLYTSLVGLAAGGGIVWIVRLVGTAALKREAMGFGDVIFMMMLGTFFGWQACVVVFFASPFAAVVVGLIQAITKRDDVLPFVPYLCLAALFVMVCWAAIWNRVEFAFRLGWLMPATLGVCFVMLGVLLFLWQQIKQRLFSGGEVR